ncbi:MAG: aminoglycoside phosphotransferase family protein [Rhodobacter sp.]|nr:aminoglycoside phosphotransferase family protein [Rhodobacter sp.]
MDAFDSARISAQAVLDAVLDTGVLGEAGRLRARIRRLPAHTNVVFEIATGHARFAAKLFPENADPKARTEYHVLRLQRDHGSCPSPLSLILDRPDLPGPLLVTTFAAGRTLSAGPVGRSLLLRAMRAFAGLAGPSVTGVGAAKMNPGCPSRMGLMLAETAGGIRPRPETTQLYNAALRRIDWIDRLAKRLPKTTTPLQLCHGDPGFNNAILGTNGSLTLVDWEDAGLGDPVCEVAKAVHHRANARWSRRLREVFRDMPMRGVSRAEYRRRFAFYDRTIPIALLLRRIAEAQRAADRDDRPAMANNLDRATQILRNTRRLQFGL